jgi:hypothetical protein
MSEIYVPELENENDLWQIIDKNAAKYLKDEKLRRKLLEFYMNVRGNKNNEGKPHVYIGGLRNLSRAI